MDFEIVGRGTDPSRGTNYVKLDDLLRRFVQQGKIKKDWRTTSAQLVEMRELALFALLPSSFPGNSIGTARWEARGAPKEAAYFVQQIQRADDTEKQLRGTLLARLAEEIPSIVATEAEEPIDGFRPPSYWSCARLFDEYCRLQPAALQKTMLGWWSDKRTELWKNLLAKWTAGNVHWADAITEAHDLLNSRIPTLADRIAASNNQMAAVERRVKQRRKQLGECQQALINECQGLGIRPSIDDEDPLAGLDVDAGFRHLFEIRVPELSAAVLHLMQSEQFQLGLSAYLSYCNVIIGDGSTSTPLAAEELRPCPILRRALSAEGSAVAELVLHSRSALLDELFELEQFYLQRKHDLQKERVVDLPGDSNLNSLQQVLTIIPAVQSSIAELSSPEFTHCFEFLCCPSYSQKIVASLHDRRAAIRKQRETIEQLEKQRDTIAAYVPALQAKLAGQTSLLRRLLSDFASELSRVDFQGAKVVFVGSKLLDSLQ